MADEENGFLAVDEAQQGKEEAEGAPLTLDEGEGQQDDGILILREPDEPAGEQHALDLPAEAAGGTAEGAKDDSTPAGGSPRDDAIAGGTAGSGDEEQYEDDYEDDGFAEEGTERSTPLSQQPVSRPAAVARASSRDGNGGHAQASAPPVGATGDADGAEGDQGQDGGAGRYAGDADEEVPPPGADAPTAADARGDDAFDTQQVLGHDRAPAQDDEADSIAVAAAATAAADAAVADGSTEDAPAAAAEPEAAPTEDVPAAPLEDEDAGAPTAAMGTGSLEQQGTQQRQQGVSDDGEKEERGSQQQQQQQQGQPAMLQTQRPQDAAGAAALYGGDEEWMMLDEPMSPVRPQQAGPGADAEFEPTQPAELEPAEAEPAESEPGATEPAAGAELQQPGGDADAADPGSTEAAAAVAAAAAAADVQQDEAPEEAGSDVAAAGPPVPEEEGGEGVPTAMAPEGTATADEQQLEDASSAVAVADGGAGDTDHVGTGAEEGGTAAAAAAEAADTEAEAAPAAGEEQQPDKEDDGAAEASTGYDEAPAAAVDGAELAATAAGDSGNEGGSRVQEAEEEGAAEVAASPGGGEDDEAEAGGAGAEAPQQKEAVEVALPTDSDVAEAAGVGAASGGQLPTSIDGMAPPAAEPPPAGGNALENGAAAPDAADAAAVAAAAGAAEGLEAAAACGVADEVFEDEALPEGAAAAELDGGKGETDAAGASASEPVAATTAATDEGTEAAAQIAEGEGDAVGAADAADARDAAAAEVPPAAGEDSAAADVDAPADDSPEAAGQHEPVGPNADEDAAGSAVADAEAAEAAGPPNDAEAAEGATGPIAEQQQEPPASDGRAVTAAADPDIAEDGGHAAVTPELDAPAVGQAPAEAVDATPATGQVVPAEGANAGAEQEVDAGADAEAEADALAEAEAGAALEVAGAEASAAVAAGAEAAEDAGSDEEAHAAVGSDAAADAEGAAGTETAADAEAAVDPEAAAPDPAAEGEEDSAYAEEQFAEPDAAPAEEGGEPDVAAAAAANATAADEGNEEGYEEEDFVEADAEESSNAAAAGTQQELHEQEQEAVAASSSVGSSSGRSSKAPAAKAAAAGAGEADGAFEEEEVEDAPSDADTEDAAPAAGSLPRSAAPQAGPGHTRHTPSSMPEEESYDDFGAGDGDGRHGDGGSQRSADGVLSASAATSPHSGGSKPQSGTASPRAESDFGAKADEYTQRYLTLLRAGSLTQDPPGLKSRDGGSGAGTPRRHSALQPLKHHSLAASGGGSPLPADEAAAAAWGTRSLSAAGSIVEEVAGQELFPLLQSFKHSVHAPVLEHLAASSRALDVAPIQLRSRPASRSRGMSGRLGGTSPQGDGAASDAGSSPRSPKPPASERRPDVSQRLRALSALPSSKSITGGALSAGLPFEVTNPFPKLYTPGPGAYTPKTDRYGAWEDKKFSFGSAAQRPPNACVQESPVSPGPRYQPDKTHVSTHTSLPNCKFGRQAVGSRFDPSGGQVSNSPHWNPGPGHYDPLATAEGAVVEPGADAPNTVFGTCSKLVPPDRFKALPYLGEDHARSANFGVHSPGPSAYSPDVSPSSMRPKLAEYSLGRRHGLYFDSYHDAARQASPGPLYTPELDKTGRHTFSQTPAAAFGRGPKVWDPSEALHAAPFLSYDHARTANAAIFSPGPRYKPDEIRTGMPHVPAPLLAGGPRDRFYDRFEPGRVN